MKTLSLALFFFSAVFAYANGLLDATEKFPDIAPWDYRPDLAAHIANLFIAADHDEAIRTLEAASKKQLSSPENERICHLCRLLFVPNSPTNLLRAPLLGAPGMMPYRSMPSAAWPYTPFAIVDNIPLSMSNGYDLGGVAETASDYLKYCINNGVIRESPYAIPTMNSVAKALDILFVSPKWNALEWKGSGQGWSYEINEDWTKSRIRKQINNCESGKGE